MVKVIREGAYYAEGRIVKESQSHLTLDRKALAAKNTIAYGILAAHNEATRLDPALRFDVVAALPDCYIDVIRAADAGGLTEFPLPCICIDEKGEAEAFGVSAAKRFGGVYVPKDTFSAEEYVRTSVAMANDLILSSFPLTVGSLGAMAMCGDAGDILNVLFSERIETERPEIVAVHLKGKLHAGVGPLDVALTVRRASDAACGFIKGRILEFIGTGIARLPQEMRNAIDACFADMGCLATVWETDDKTDEYFRGIGRTDAFYRLSPKQPAYYDGAILVDLGTVEPMASIGGAVFSVRELLDEPAEVLGKAEQTARRAGLSCDFRSLVKGKDIPVAGVRIDGQGQYETLARMAEFLRGKQSVPVSVACSQPVRRAREKGGYLEVFPPCTLPEGLIVGDGLLRLDACTAAASAVAGKVVSVPDLDYPRRVKKYRHTVRQIERKISDFTGAPKKVKLVWGDIPPAPICGRLPDALLLKAIPAGEEGDFSEASDIVTKFSLPIGTVCGKLAVYRDLPVYDDGFRAALALRSRGVLAVLAKEYGSWLSACIDWGMVPFVSVKAEQIGGGYLYLKGVRSAVEHGTPLQAQFLGEDKTLQLAFPVMPQVAHAWLILGGKIRARGGEQ